mgnify:CR=1 FL=1
MKKSFIKFSTDFGPLIIFFIFYYNNDKNLKVAIPPFIIATLIALLVIWFLEKKIPMMPLISGILISLFGGLAIYFNNSLFIYIKPTIINILFGLTLLFAKYFSLGVSGVILSTNMCILFYLIVRKNQYQRIITKTANGIWNE